MTEKDLQAIRARAEAATPGPWTATTVDSVAGGNIYGQGWVVASAAIYPPDGWTADGFPSAPKAFIDTDANAAFIAHAREDVSALLDEVERLRGQLATMEAVIERAGEADVAVSGRLTALETENAALREVARAVAKGGNADDFSERARYRLQYRVYASDEMREKARKLLGIE